LCWEVGRREGMTGAGLEGDAHIDQLVGAPDELGEYELVELCWPIGFWWLCVDHCWLWVEPKQPVVDLCWFRAELWFKLCWCSSELRWLWVELSW
jgi:hypothetical protein